MSADNIWKRLSIWLKSLAKTTQPEDLAAGETNGVASLLRMIEQTDEVEFSCDQVFELLDQYAELAMRGEDVAHLQPLVKRHLERCMDCREEYEALLGILESAIGSGG